VQLPFKFNCFGSAKRDEIKKLSLGRSELIECNDRVNTNLWVCKSEEIRTENF